MNVQATLNRLSTLYLYNHDIHMHGKCVCVTIIIENKVLNLIIGNMGTGGGEKVFERGE